MEAMVREFKKDVNNTMHQVFFGQPAQPGEPGTPLNPTPQNVTDSLRTRSEDANKQTDIDIDF